MKRIFIGLLTLIFVTLFIRLLPVFAEQDIKLEIVYPKNGAKTNAATIFFSGNTDPQASLTINNKAAKVWPNGAFVELVPLERGQNTIILRAQKEHAQKELKYTINVAKYEKTLPSFPLKIEETSIIPNKNLLYRSGDVIFASFKGSTGRKASFSIGEKVKNITMKEQPPKNISTPPAFGKTTQVSAMPVGGIYSGFYKIKPEDDFNNEQIKIELSSGKEKISVLSKAKVSTISKNVAPIIAETTKDFAVTRTTPDGSRLTPLPKGTMIAITGKIGDSFRFKYSDSLSGWISEKDVQLMEEGTFLPESFLTLLSLDTEDDYTVIRIPLSQRIPFIIEQNAENKIKLKLYGAKANIDLFSYEKNNDFIGELQWVQDSDDALSLIIRTSQKQFWGYKYCYEGNTLVLKLRNQPSIKADCPLYGKIICLDPGHGGTEAGAIGPTGVPEKQINLEISLKLKKILEAKGAKVIMTRQGDQNVELSERVKIANDADSHILLSIHNNSLPDSRDPYKEHGTSSYYYHSQSLPMTKHLQTALVGSTGFKNFGYFWSSFMLTRPSENLAALLEIGFMINPEEYNQLITAEFQEQVACGIAEGLENFLLSQINKDKNSFSGNDE